jgi:hypothetical protein
MQMKKTCAEKTRFYLWGAFCLLFTIFTLQSTLHAKTFQGPSGGAYSPTFWDRAFIVVPEFMVDAWFLFSAIRDVVRWLRRGVRHGP